MNKKLGLLKTVIIVAVIVILAELSLFNFSAITQNTNGLEKHNIELSRDNFLSGEVELVSDNSYQLNSNDPTILEFENVGIQADNMLLQTVGDSKFCTVKVYITDENRSVNFVPVFNGEIYTGSDTLKNIKIQSGGKLKKLRLEFYNAKDIRIKGIKLNYPIPFRFNVFRVALLFLLCLTVAVIIKKRLYRVIYNPENIKHTVAVGMCALLCALCTVFVGAVHSDNAVVKYPLENRAKNYTPYIQQFDAFMKGQTHLDIDPDPFLERMEDPYDAEQRKQMGVDVSWDRAYYNGKYYSYYGTTPIFQLYYPVYFLSGHIPTEGFACQIYASLLSALTVMLVAYLTRLYVKKANLLLMLISSVAAVVAGNVMLICVIGDFYCLPLLSALFNLSLFIWLSATAYKQRKIWRFALAGIFFVFAVASRPNTALLGLCVAPAFISLLREKQTAVSEKVKFAAAFMVPVVLGAVGIMSYNYVRFGSVTDFGSAYQLTVSNISYNKLSLSKLLPSLYHYFVQPMASSFVFPFAAPSSADVTVYPGYIYSAKSFGVFCYPLTLLVLALPLLKEKGKKWGVVPVSLFTVAVMAAAVAFLDFCLGGINIRYVSDIALMLSIASVLILLCLEERVRDNRLAHRLICAAAVVLIAITLFRGVTVLFSTSPYNIKKDFPEVYSMIMELFRV
ncbi:MAG: hypothetical protein IJF54_03580 [Clostridia bacterium]|nr:hypothetical protein [Clostridia bacterium]